MSFGGRMASFLGALALIAAVVLAAPRDAQAQVSFGPQVSYGEGIEAMGVGGRLAVDIPGASGFGLAGSFDYFFPDGDVDYWEVNGNLTYTFQSQGSVGPYLGGGLNLANSSVDLGGLPGDESETEAGANILGGLKIGTTGPITPYVEGRYGTAFDGQFVVTGGILF